MVEQIDERSGIAFGWPPGASGWGAEVNENFRLLAYRGNSIRVNSAVSRNQPPANPTESDCYIVGASATAEWDTFPQHSLAVYGHSVTGGTLAWQQITPLNGMDVWDESTKTKKTFDGDAWVDGTTVGATGQRGPKGDQGDPGPQGERGNTGPQGQKGDKGDPGTPGRDGTDGTDGARGERGERGPAGPQGERGDTGPRGDVGAQGERGPQGPKGDKGDTGPAGPSGGPPGPKGDKGDTGPKGDQGDPGVAGSTTLAGLTDVTITNPATGQVVKFDGTTWTNQTDETGTGGGTGEQNVQADWDETSTTDDSYIQNKPDIPEIIADQAGGRIDDLTQAVSKLTLTLHDTTGDTISFSDQGDILKSVNNVDPYGDGEFMLLDISGYDPIIIDSTFLRNKTAKTPPVSFANVDRDFGDSYSQEFVLMRDGGPVHVSGSDPKKYHTIRLGRSSANAPLIAKIQPETNLTLTVKLGRLTAAATGGTGPQGPPGPRGQQGPRGDTGPRGDRGPQGERGNPGATGQRGPKGDTGATGMGGDTGPQGLTGDRGPKGDKGDTGSAGVGVPIGGDTDQILAKRSDTNYDTKWANPYTPPLKLQDFLQALEDDEGWQDDTGSGAATVATTAGSLTTTLTQAKALTYGTNYTNPNAYAVTGYVVIVRIPETADDLIYRLADEEPPGDSTRTADGGAARYGELYYQYSITSDTLSWVKINETADNGYFYYRVPTSNIRGNGMLYIQKFNRMVIDKTKVDAGYENWAEKGNTDLIPRSKMPPSVSKHAQEMVNQVRGISLASTSTAVNNSLNPFTRQLTLASTDHGVFFTDLQASVHSGSTSQLALDMTTVSLQNLSHMSQLRGTTAYDNSVGSVGNGLLVGSFDVNNTSGVKQGTVNCYIARNSSNQVGTYNSYVPETGASSSLAGQIIIDWEVSLLRTDSTGTGGGMGSGFTQAQIEEFARDAIAAALEAGDNASTVDINFRHSDPLNTISATIKPGSILPIDIKKESAQSTRAASLSAWQTLFNIPASGGSTATNVLTKQSDSNTASIGVSATHTLRTIMLNAQQLLFRELEDYDLYEQASLTLSASAANTHVKVQAVKGATGTEVIAETKSYTLQTTADDYKVVLPLGSDDTSYRLQLVNLSAANTVSMTSNSNITYPRIKYVVGAERDNPPRLSEAVSLHVYDAAESFNNPLISRNAEAMAFNAQKNILSIIDESGNHIAVNPDTGVQESSDWSFNIIGITGDCFACWDTTGRYLYVLEDGSTSGVDFRVYDIGTGSTPSPTRVSSKEITITTTLISSFASVEGISIDSGGIRLIVRKSSPTRYEIVTLSLTGSVVTAQSGIAIVRPDLHETRPNGLVVYDNFTKCYVAYTDSWVASFNIVPNGATYNLEIVKGESFPIRTRCYYGLTRKAVGNQLYLTHESANQYVGAHDIQVYDKVVDTTVPRVWRKLSAWDIPWRSSENLAMIIPDPNSERLYQIINDSSTWDGSTSSDLVHVNVLRSVTDPTVISSSPNLERAPHLVGGGFIKEGKLYCAEVSNPTNLRTVDLTSFSVSSSTTVTLSGFGSTGDYGQPIKQLYGDETHFWVVKNVTAYGFNLSDFSRNTSKDFRLTERTPASNNNGYRFVTGNSTHVFSGRYDSNGHTVAVARLKSTMALDPTADISISGVVSFFLYLHSADLIFACSSSSSDSAKGYVRTT